MRQGVGTVSAQLTEQNPAPPVGPLSAGSLATAVAAAAAAAIPPCLGMPAPIRTTPSLSSPSTVQTGLSVVQA